jgi:hypothetical protein
MSVEHEVSAILSYIIYFNYEHSKYWQWYACNKRVQREKRKKRERKERVNRKREKTTHSVVSKRVPLSLLSRRERRPCILGVILCITKENCYGK